MTESLLDKAILLAICGALIVWIKESYVKRHEKIDYEMRLQRDEFRSELKEVEHEIKQFRNVLSSYMETTIKLNDRFDRLDKSLERLLTKED